MEIIAKINNFFKECFANAQTFPDMNHSKKTSEIDPQVVGLVTKQIPQKLTSLINDKNYKIYGSVGKGIATKTPWIAILDTRITKSTRTGVYIVFLFSSDYKHVYLTLNQGTTVPGKFGPRLKSIDIERNARNIREKLNQTDSRLSTDGNALINDERYRAGAVYYTLWNENDNEGGKELLMLYLKIYKNFHSLISGSNKYEHDLSVLSEPTIKPQNDVFSIKFMIKQINETGLIYTPELIKRFAFSLMTKPFVILSGLAGSGKTQLAITFAKALVEDCGKQLCTVSVGADWTNREPLLGFPNALQHNQYVRPESRVLDLLIEANKPENKNKPYFLILDEMNMSYVERYFADFLSAMESKEAIPLWNGCPEPENEDDEWDDTPTSIKLPNNLFIIGTINVDETTYMFSPKVLDRANVIEFKISSDEMAKFLTEMRDIDRDSITSKAANMGANFVEKASRNDLAQNEEAKKTLTKFFEELKKVNAEFGYRSATEIFRFICQAEENDDTEQKMTIEHVLDAAIVQKLLPKLHGSRKKLEPVLQQLWKLCFTEKDSDIKVIMASDINKAVYKESADKIFRMYDSACANGFTSFAEA